MTQENAILGTLVLMVGVFIIAGSIGVRLLGLVAAVSLVGVCAAGVRRIGVPQAAPAAPQRTVCSSPMAPRSR